MHRGIQMALLFVVIIYSIYYLRQLTSRQSSSQELRLHPANDDENENHDDTSLDATAGTTAAALRRRLRRLTAKERDVIASAVSASSVEELEDEIWHVDALRTSIANALHDENGEEEQEEEEEEEEKTRTAKLKKKWDKMRRRRRIRQKNTKTKKPSTATTTPPPKNPSTAATPRSSVVDHSHPTTAFVPTSSSLTASSFPTPTYASFNNDLTLTHHDNMMIAGSFVFSGEGCTPLGDQCSVDVDKAAQLCLSFGDRCVGYTCNKDRSDCQLRGHPISHQRKQRFHSYYRKGMFELAEEIIVTQKRLDRLALEQGKGKLAASDFNWNGICGVNGYKCVVSYGLYGSNPKYTEGAIQNAQLVKDIWPGWICRFYHDSSVPQPILQRLLDLGSELIRIDHIQGGIAGMFWRFLVASDPKVDRYEIRDSDSRLNKRDFEAVKEWMKSGFSIHTVRDHPNHARPLNGGMWGGVRGAIPNMPELIQQATHSLHGYGGDLDFLSVKVWPLVENDQMAHDSYSCTQFKNSFPFPTQRQNFEHVGQVFENNQPRQGDITCCLINNPAPEECRKHKEWVFG